MKRGAASATVLSATVASAAKLLKSYGYMQQTRRLYL
jgi:hypothetical protein